MLKFKDLPDEEKPRERLLLYGSDNLSNEELLMILFKTGTRNYTVKEVVNNLLISINSIRDLRNVTYSRLVKIPGIGKVKAIELLAIIEFSRRLNTNTSEVELINCTDPLTIISYFNDLFVSKKQEEFYVLYLDNKKKYIDKKKLFVGSINTTITHPREIFKEAYLLSASFFICIHNHPSGDPTPSKNDIVITNNLKSIGELHAIYLIDHIIIGNNCYYSFYENDNILNNGEKHII